MKRTHKCPKCGSTEIRRFGGEHSSYNIGNNIRMSAFSQALVTRYVCYNCGFSEEWVESPYLEQLRNKKP